jgi:argininosuccinate synthase
MLKWLRNSLNKDYLLASALDLVNQEELTATSLKEKSLSSTQRKLTKERNDLMNSVIYPSFKLKTFYELRFINQSVAL